MYWAPLRSIKIDLHIVMLSIGWLCSQTGSFQTSWRAPQQTLKVADSWPRSTLPPFQALKCRCMALLEATVVKALNLRDGFFQFLLEQLGASSISHLVIAAANKHFVFSDDHENGGIRGGGVKGAAKLSFATAGKKSANIWLTFTRGPNSMYVPVELIEGDYLCPGETLHP